METNKNLIPVIGNAQCVLAQNNRYRNVVPRQRILVLKTWQRIWCPLMDYTFFSFMRKTIHTHLQAGVQNCVLITNMGMIVISH